MTRPVTHIWRLLGWGRTLARHGALRGIERDDNTPAPVRRLCRIARLGTFQPRLPDYAGAFQEIGPAAIKLGQTLATRPDLVGEEAAANLLSLQDSLAHHFRRGFSTNWGDVARGAWAVGATSRIRYGTRPIARSSASATRIPRSRIAPMSRSMPS